MGNHQQEPGADSSEYVDYSSMQSAKQQKRKKQNRPGQIDRSMAEVCTHAPETSLAGLPFHTSLGIQPRPHGPSEQTHPLTAQHTKRPLVGGTSESSTKRCRISSSVNVPKPSLMVKFELTPAKGVPNRGKTAPPQQSTTSMPSPELPSLDEIIDRRSMAPIDRRSDMASTESWTQPADHQPIARQHMQASVESVAESDEDTTPVPSGSPPTQTAPHVPTLANASTQASSATHEIAASDSSSHPKDALDIELELYIDGKANMNLAEPDAWLMLTDMTNRDELFRLAKDLLEALGHLDAGDEIVAVIFKRPDGEVIPGTSMTSTPVTRLGQQDMWKRLVKNMSGAGTWKGELRGYVRVQKTVHGE
jgi:hypothetical protein